MNLESFTDFTRRRSCARWGITESEFISKTLSGLIWCRKHRGWFRPGVDGVAKNPNSGICRSCEARYRAQIRSAKEAYVGTKA